MDLHSAALQSGFTIEHHISVGSTNDLAMAYLKAGGAGRHFVLADAQEQGRGRLGRTWVSKPGNLYVSLALRDPCEMAKAFQLGFVASLVVRKSLEAVGVAAASLALKWPNDVLFNGSKISGILIEGARLPDQTFATVIGIGINLADHPTDTPYPATDLRAEGIAVSVVEMVRHFASAWQTMLARFDEGRGFSALRAEWLSYAKGVGDLIHVRGAEGSSAGIFAGLDDEGRLLLDSAGRITPVIAGDVFF